jgi:hypothetical protein
VKLRSAGGSRLSGCARRGLGVSEQSDERSALRDSPSPYLANDGRSFYRVTFITL